MKLKDDCLKIMIQRNGGMIKMTKKELLELIKDMPDEAPVVFYDCQYEHVHWWVNTVKFDEQGRIILTDEYL